MTTIVAWIMPLIRLVDSYDHGPVNEVLGFLKRTAAVCIYIDALVLGSSTPLCCLSRRILLIQKRRVLVPFPLQCLVRVSCTYVKSCKLLEERLVDEASVYVRRNYELI